MHRELSLSVSNLTNCTLFIWTNHQLALLPHASHSTLYSTSSFLYNMLLLRRYASSLFLTGHKTEMMMELANCRDTVVVSICIVDQRNRDTISSQLYCPLYFRDQRNICSSFHRAYYWDWHSLRSVSTARWWINVCSSTKFTALF